MSYFSYGILSSKEFNQRVKRFYPNQIHMLFRTPKGNDRNYGYVLFKNLFTNEIVYPHSAHWFKRKKEAQVSLDTYKKYKEN
jgi:hypothetical protein